VRAMRTGRELPSIQLYRVGDDYYYVLDGDHRVREEDSGCPPLRTRPGVLAAQPVEESRSQTWRDPSRAMCMSRRITSGWAVLGPGCTATYMANHISATSACGVVRDERRIVAETRNPCC
jgi:hypothetical protein